MAMPNDIKERREKAEKLIYDVLDAADVTHSNSDYYKEVFSKMSDEQFYNFFKKKLPLRFHQTAFKVEPKMYEIDKAFHILGAPLYEVVNLPYLYKDSKGRPIRSKPAMVVYLHIKRMKQMLAKKTSIAMSISERDMRTGLLINHSKAAKMSDREEETLALPALDATVDEFARLRADAMISKEKMYSIISTTGKISAEEVQPEKDEVLSKKMFYTYLLGANIISNLIGEDDGYINPHTIKNHQQQLERQY